MNRECLATKVGVGKKHQAKKPGSLSIGWQNPYSTTRGQFTGYSKVQETHTNAQWHTHTHALTHTIQSFIRENLAVNQAFKDFCNPATAYETRIKNNCLSFLTSLVPVQAT